MYQAQALLSVQRFCRNTQPLEVVENIRFNAVQPGLCGFQSIRLDAKRQILCFHQPVVALCQLIPKHLRVLRADTVIHIAPQRNGDLPAIGFLIGGHIHEGQLEAYRGIKVVEKITPSVKDGGFIVVLRQLVVDVLELNRLGVIAFRDPADTVREHPLKGNTVLSGFMFLVLPLCPCDCGFDLPAFRSCEFSCC